MNEGFINENQLREYINNKFYDDFNLNIKSLLSFLFNSNLNKNLPFYVEKKGGELKPDLLIKHNNIQKYVSVKKGTGNSVHQETVDVFFPYIEHMISTSSFFHLKLFHYGDDTTDDTGKTRYSANVSKKRYSKEIEQLNVELNKWEILSKLLDRFLFIGNVGDDPVDLIYHGTIDQGLWATRDEIINYIKNNSFNSNAVHFGPLTYQVWGRNDKWTAKHPERRYTMQVKWGKLHADLTNIRKKGNQ